MPENIKKKPIFDNAYAVAYAVAYSFLGQKTGDSDPLLPLLRVISAKKQAIRYPCCTQNIAVQTPLLHT
jgi:hypothetical protein